MGSRCRPLSSIGSCHDGRKAPRAMTWAIPEWWLALPPDRLGDYCGYITGKP